MDASCTSRITQMDDGMTADPSAAPDTADLPSPRDVLAYWFETLTMKDWFVKDETVDADITARFKALHEALAVEQPDEWIDTPEARLALVIALDQFPRNIWRESAHAFATDPLALAHSKVLRDGGVEGFSDEMKLFAFLPFEHSEDMADQHEAVRLIDGLGEPGPDGKTYGDYARAHRDVIERFGRFPHRNAALGRESTEEERAWLEAGGGF